MDEAFLLAGTQCGYHVNDDFNGEQQDGFGLYDHAIAKGLRVSASSSYLDPAKNRSNLSIRTDTTVTRLQLQGKRVTCVELLTYLLRLGRYPAINAPSTRHPQA